MPFGGEDVEPAQKKEKLFDWRMRTQVKFYKDYCIGIDKMLGQGITVFKITWEYTTRTYIDFFDLHDLNDKAQAAIEDPRTSDDMLVQMLIEELGVDDEFDENLEELKRVVAEFRDPEDDSTEFELKLVEVEHNRPKVTARDLREDLVIPIDTTDLQYARFIKDDVWALKNDIKKDMRDEKYQEYSDDDMSKWTQSKKQKPQSGEDELILLHEVCVWYDVNNDDIKERCIITYPENNPEDVLRFIEVPYDDGLFPYEDVQRELIDPGIYKSRSISELDKDYQIGITQSVNQAEDNGTIVNRPVIVMKRNTVTNVKNRSYIPGEVVETNSDPNDYQIRAMTNTSQPALLQFAQYLKSWADHRLGNITAGSSDPTNPRGMAEGGKKTKAEIDMLSGLQGKVEGFDLQVFQDQMAKVYAHIDALYDQFGDDEEEVLTTGEAPVRINRREIQGKRDIVPNGRLDNTNPQLRSQKAFNLMRVFAGDPDIRQYELKKLFLMDYDSRIAKLILYTPEERAQQEEQKTAQLEQLKARALQEGMDLKQIDIMLDIVKEQQIAVIHGRKYAPDEVKSTSKQKDRIEEPRP